MKSINVVSIGVFGNGSFGVFGLPVGGAELWRVDCPELRSAIARDFPALTPDYDRFTFASQKAAEEFAKIQVTVEADRDLEEKNRVEAAEKLAAEIKAANCESLKEIATAAVDKMFPGRVAATIARDRAVIAGVWADGLIPGFGRPVAVYRLKNDGTVVQADDSYKFAF